jgi:hypothetical protein
LKARQQRSCAQWHHCATDIRNTSTLGGTR